MVAHARLTAPALARRSVEIIRSNQTDSGAYLASPAFAVYRYSWLRDGAFIADAMSRAGEADSALAFLEWCRRIVETRAGRIQTLLSRQAASEPIPLADFLHTRYTVDGHDADEAWWNHQLDGYGAWLWALGAHLGRHRSAVDVRRFSAAVETTARYLIAFWDHACYDCWEENPEQVHVATLAAIHAGLRVAAHWPGVAGGVQQEAQYVLTQVELRVRHNGTRGGRLVKWLGGSELDASLLFCSMPYGLVAPDDPLMRSTISSLSPELAHLGVHRHSSDTYFGGGEWILLAAALGSYYASLGQFDAARAQLEWVVAQADDDGNLPEQVSGHLLHPAAYRSWVERWGTIASPLLWSHAMFLNLHSEVEESA